MHGHGAFVYQPDFAIERFGAARGVADALAAMDMSHAWLRVHGRNGAWRPDANQALAEAFRAAGIRVGVWGWNDGNDVDLDVANAVAAIDRYDPYAYIADIEHGVGGACWTAPRAKAFATAVKARLGARPLVVSSFGYIVAHQPEIMAAMDGIADFFAPQVYWFRYPEPSMVPGDDPVLGGLPTDSPAATRRSASTTGDGWSGRPWSWPDRPFGARPGTGPKTRPSRSSRNSSPGSWNTRAWPASTGGIWPTLAPCRPGCVR